MRKKINISNNVKCNINLTKKKEKFQTQNHRNKIVKINLFRFTQPKINFSCSFPAFFSPNSLPFPFTYNQSNPEREKEKQQTDIPLTNQKGNNKIETAKETKRSNILLRLLINLMCFSSRGKLNQIEKIEKLYENKTAFVCLHAH